MNKNSKTYLKLSQLEKEGFREHLINEVRQSAESEGDTELENMGTNLAKVQGFLSQKADFLKGKIWDQVDEDDEYEVPDDPKIETPEDRENDEGSKDESDDQDPVLYAQTSEFSESCRKIANIFSIKYPPSFEMDVPLELQSKFMEMIEWINKTSDSKYSMSLNGSQTRITHLGSKAFMPSAPTESVVSETLSKGDSDEYDITETESNISKYTATQSAKSCAASTSHMSSSAQSIIAQLSSGIYLLPKSAKDKRKLFTLSNLNVTESMVASILSKNPRMTLQELLKIILKKSNKWSLINKFYNVSEYVVKNE